MYLWVGSEFVSLGPHLPNACRRRIDSGHDRRGKSDLILEGVLRVEKLLQDMGASLVRKQVPLTQGLLLRTQ